MDVFDINSLIADAKKGDILSRNNLIEANKGFIRRISSYICKRSLDWSNDDELSIALMAFNEAIDTFDPHKGMEFKGYFKMLVHSRLVDYFRKNKDTHVSLNSMDDEELSMIENREAIARYSASYASSEMAAEIKMFNKELAVYGLSLSELTVNCPKHRDTRETLFEIALKCSKQSDIVMSLKKNKMLPIKNIMELTGVNRKFLDKWRRYLIALITIVSSDEYLYLKEYINFKG